MREKTNDVGYQSGGRGIFIGLSFQSGLSHVLHKLVHGWLEHLFIIRSGSEFQ